MATYTPISASYAGTMSFTPQAPAQRQWILDATNPQYQRNWQLTQDSLYFSFTTISAVFPLAELAQVAIQGVPTLSWPPVITLQPTNSFTTYPPLTSSYFVISASSYQQPITYQWYFNSGSLNWIPIGSGISGSIFFMSTTPALTSSNNGFESYHGQSASFYCVASNSSGVTTSSIATLFII